MNAHALTTKTDGLIRTIVQHALSGSSVSDVEISVGQDHDGEEAIIVEIIYEAPEPDVDPTLVARLMMSMNNELQKAGETRFAYLYNRASQGEPSFGPR